MAAELDLALFEEELEQVRALPEANRWVLERGGQPLELLATMHPLRKPSDLFKARIRWPNYFGPFSLKFLNFQTGAETDPNAWPRCFGFRPSSFDACLPWTLEGHGLHPEWKSSPSNRFPQVEAPMHYALRQIQFSLDSSYQGRGPQ